MTAGEASLLLALAAAHDGREITDIAPAAWADCLRDVTLADGQRAVSEFYSNPPPGAGRPFIRVSDIRRIVHRVNHAGMLKAAEMAVERRGLTTMTMDREKRQEALSVRHSAMAAYRKQHPFPDMPRQEIERGGA